MGRRNRNDADVHGIVVIDKPAGCTSHDVVAQVRRALGTRRVGHSGTLDPDATGVLIIGVGRATRLLRFLTDLPKTYEGDLVLGVETNTLDAAGEVTATHDMSAVTADQVAAAATRFVGAIEQIPPMVSAIKVDGRRLHELAREGVEIEREPRAVTVHELTTTPTSDPLVHRLHVECSSGTYVRTLAADIGTALGGGGHLRGLRRLAIGSFSVDRAHPVESLVVLDAATGLADYEHASVDAETIALVRNGRVLDRTVLGVESPGPWRVLGPDGQMVAMYEPHGDEQVKPAVVLAGA